MTEKIYLETFEKCPGSAYFPLLKECQIILFFIISTPDFIWLHPKLTEKFILS